eukprot:CAMPEP_0194276152 /NCGR_PEP_ID=MMETSP0169-20130528/8817_1 /TAXON_ID=218684 /ORGANISM="Corethron pennatum, Strain L29A3" /LENGTH=333 /DNA_ID=CAMNT_0039019797 /DNA_START=218 /DNA_END=1219 /DNA_ORIENTATION=+
MTNNIPSIINMMKEHSFTAPKINTLKEHKITAQKKAVVVQNEAIVYTNDGKPSKKRPPALGNLWEQIDDDAFQKLATFAQNDATAPTDDGKPSKKRPRALGKRWDQADDDELKKLVALHGTEQWDAIGRNFPLRSKGQCRDRWETILDSTLKRGGWTPAEDAIITGMTSTVGNRWVQIARSLPGRTPNSVKGRFFSLQKKSRPAAEKAGPGPRGTVRAIAPKRSRPSCLGVRETLSVPDGPDAAPARTFGHVAPRAVSPSSFLSFRPSHFQLEALEENAPSHAQVVFPPPDRIAESEFSDDDDDLLLEMSLFVQELVFQTDPVVMNIAGISCE